jgi:L-glyceraldehyde 3-phosphate reductase
MDYVDIFYTHRFDPETPLEETLGALNTAVQQGKALYIGISSYSSDQTRAATEICRENGWAKILIHQPNYSMFNRWIEKRLTGVCREVGAGIIAFCPLYQGLLTDKYLDGIPKQSRAKMAPEFLRSEDMSLGTMNVVRELNEIAKSRGQTLAQMAIAWILRLPEITSVVCGASRSKQIVDNCAAMKNREFSPDELSKIDQLLSQAKLPSSLWYRETE